MIGCLSRLKRGVHKFPVRLETITYRLYLVGSSPTTVTLSDVVTTGGLRDLIVYVKQCSRIMEEKVKGTCSIQDNSGFLVRPDKIVKYEIVEVVAKTAIVSVEVFGWIFKDMKVSTKYL